MIINFLQLRGELPCLQTIEPQPNPRRYCRARRFNIRQKTSCREIEKVQKNLAKSFINELNNEDSYAPTVKNCFNSNESGNFIYIKYSVYIS